MGVILDLDLTLVDSRSAATLRKQRDWSKVYECIPNFTVYKGVVELLDSLARANVPMAVVTTSPSSYATRVIKHFKFPLTNLVAYHDVKQRKPHPEGMLMALQKMDVPRESAVAIGDDPKDIQAARSAGILSIGAFWGTTDAAALDASAPDLKCLTVEKLLGALKQRFKF